MNKNIGSLDRNIRIGLGVIIAGWGLFDQNWLGLIGLVPLATALIGWCPAYTLIGVNTGAPKQD